MRVGARLEAKLALVTAAREVRGLTGKGILRQFREIARLRFGVGRLRASEYYAYEVFDDELYGPSAKREVVSWNGLALYRRFNDRHWTAIGDDKLLTYAVLKGLGLPFPDVYAVYHAGGRTFGNIPSFSSADAMAAFLRTHMRYPAFGKPVCDSLGQGASSLKGVASDSDVLVLAGGEQVTVDDYLRRYVLPSRSGYLFQQRVTPHPDLREVCGDRTSTLRMVMLLTGEGPLLHRAVWRIPTGRNVTDNFARGRSGNIKAWIDLPSGTVQRAVRSAPDNGRVRHLGSLGIPITDHPDTGRRLVGFTVPDWEDAVALCTQAAAAFPELRYQCWDVAPSEDGPVIVELNCRGFVTQVPGCSGFNDGQFRHFFGSVRG